MTKEQAECLRKTIKGLHYYNDVNDDGRAILRFLAGKEYCYIQPYTEPVYRITQKGREALQEFDDKAKKDAEDERQRSFQNKASIAQVLVPIITFILGVVFENRVGIAETVSAFVGWCIKYFIH